MGNVEQFLILEWIGRWAIPDFAHGGIFPGPYPSKASAQTAIDMRVKHEEKSMRAPCSFGEPLSEDYIADSTRHLRARHAIVAVPDYPVVEPIP